MRDRQACHQFHSALAEASPDLLLLLNRALSEGYAAGEEDGYHTGSGDNPSGIVNAAGILRRSSDYEILFPEGTGVQPPDTAPPTSPGPAHALPGPPGALARRPAPRPRGRARPPDALLRSLPPQGAHAGPPGPGRGRRRRPRAPHQPAGRAQRPVLPLTPSPPRINKPQGGPQRPAAAF